MPLDAHRFVTFAMAMSFPKFHDISDPTSATVMGVGSYYPSGT